MRNIHNTLTHSSEIPSSHQIPPLTTTTQTAENPNNLDNQFNRVTNASQSLPLTSTEITTDDSEKVYPDINIGESLECTTIKILYENV